jgi:hypothetical protein
MHQPWLYAGLKPPSRIEKCLSCLPLTLCVLLLPQGTARSAFPVHVAVARQQSTLRRALAR